MRVARAAAPATRWWGRRGSDPEGRLELTENEDAVVVRMEVPGMDATFKNGALVVTLPKMPAANGSTIFVKPE